MRYAHSSHSRAIGSFGDVNSLGGAASEGRGRFAIAGSAWGLIFLWRGLLSFIRDLLCFMRKLREFFRQELLFWFMREFATLELRGVD